MAKPSQDYTTNPDDHSNHNIVSLGSNLSLLYGVTVTAQQPMEYFFVIVDLY